MKKQVKVSKAKAAGMVLAGKRKKLERAVKAETKAAAASTPKKKEKGKPRPNTPTSFSFAEGATLATSWDDEGMRHAGAIVGSRRYIWSEDQERWLEQLELVQYPALSLQRHVTVLGTHGRWMGPRETAYELREPNALEMHSIREIIRKETLLRQQGQQTRTNVVGSRGPSASEGLVIHVLKSKCEFKGKRAVMFAKLKTGMTKKEVITLTSTVWPSPYPGFLSICLEKGLIDIRSENRQAAGAKE